MIIRIPNSFFSARTLMTLPMPNHFSPTLIHCEDFAPRNQSKIDRTKSHRTLIEQQYPKTNHLPGLQVVPRNRSRNTKTPCTCTKTDSTRTHTGTNTGTHTGTQAQTNKQANKQRDRQTNKCIHTHHAHTHTGITYAACGRKTH